MVVASPGEEPMQIPSVHQNFPAQFGHIASYLRHSGLALYFFIPETAQRQGRHRARPVPYSRAGPPRRTTIARKLRERHLAHPRRLRILGRPTRPPPRSGCRTLRLSLHRLFPRWYDRPVVNYFEYYYRTADPTWTFVLTFPVSAINRLRACARNANILLDLENCDLGYSPKCAGSRAAFRPCSNPKFTIFDGIDTTLWQPCRVCRAGSPGKSSPTDLRIVTYVARGMESLRGS